MRKLMTAVVLAASIMPVVAEAATRPAAVSYAAPANLAPGMRVGASVGKSSKLLDGDLIGPLLVAAVAFGGGYLVGHSDRKTRVITIPGGNSSPN